MRKIAFVHTGSFFHLATAADPAVKARNVIPVYWPDYEGNFSEFDALYLAARCHPGVIAQKHGQILAFLRGEGAVGGDPVGGDLAGGDSVGGDSAGGDLVGGDLAGGDPVGGDPVGGDPVGGDPVGGDPVGGDSAGEAQSHQVGLDRATQAGAGSAVASSAPGRKVYIDGISAVDSWLPGTSEIPRGTNFWSWRTGEDLGRRSVNRDHPLWDILNDRSVHWHYHGVLAPPEGATALVVLEEVEQTGPGVDPWGGEYLAVPGHPNMLLYHDAETFPAEIVVSTMDASYHHGSGFMPGATQLLYRMLNWLGSSAR